MLWGLRVFGPLPSIVRKRRAAAGVWFGGGKYVVRWTERDTHPRDRTLSLSLSLGCALSLTHATLGWPGGGEKRGRGGGREDQAERSSAQCRCDERSGERAAKCGHLARMGEGPGRANERRHGRLQAWGALGGPRHRETNHHVAKRNHLLGDASDDYQEGGAFFRSRYPVEPVNASQASLQSRHSPSFSPARLAS